MTRHHVRHTPRAASLQAEAAIQQDAILFEEWTPLPAVGFDKLCKVSPAGGLFTVLCDMLKYQDRVKVSNAELMGLTGLYERAFDRARVELLNAGLIAMDGGKKLKRASSHIYSMGVNATATTNSTQEMVSQ